MNNLYFLANASLTLRVVEYLQTMEHFSGSTVTVIHQLNGWIVKVKFDQSLTPRQKGDFKALMSELGIAYEPKLRLQMVFWSLETGRSCVEVMRCYRVAVVSHGQPNIRDIEAFRQQFTEGLGYCPETLA